MGNLEKILVGIIIVTIVAILGLAIWGLGGQDPSKHEVENSPAVNPPETEPLPDVATPASPVVAEIPSGPSNSSSEINRIATRIDEMAQEYPPRPVDSATSTVARPTPPTPSEPLVEKSSAPRIDPYPTFSERARKYTVKKGDTYERIARTELGDPGRWKLIAELNKDVPPNKLHPGSMIVLPSSDDVARAKSSPSKATTDSSKALASSSSSGSTHTVKKGDTLYSIAREYLRDGNKWRLIADANPGKIRGSSEIAAGTTLRIPKR